MVWRPREPIAFTELGVAQRDPERFPELSTATEIVPVRFDSAPENVQVHDHAVGPDEFWAVTAAPDAPATVDTADFWAESAAVQA